MNVSHRKPGKPPPKPPINSRRPSRKPLVCEFRHLLLQHPSRVIVDFERAVVCFVNCHQRRPESFWSMPFRPPDELFECPFRDILTVSEFRQRGHRTLNIITTEGAAAVPRTIMFAKTSNYERLQDVLGQVAQSTPSAPFWQTADAGWVLLVIAIAAAGILATLIDMLS